VQILKSIKDLSRHRKFSRLHLGHKCLAHFGCATGFSWLCHAFFGWNFILGCGPYQRSSFPWRHPSFFGHFFLMCNSTLLYHMDNFYFIFPSYLFGRFWQESYASMWEHYGSRIVRVLSKPLNEALSSTTNILWWYRPSFYEGLCPICFSKELGFSASVFVL
jgi:hypothetical protein